ncbi:MAG: hypothetical protein KF782_17160 [Labilithrix sp.]|nr:hypothetical protein [Labilithrix sp.]
MKVSAGLSSVLLMAGVAALGAGCSHGADDDAGEDGAEIVAGASGAPKLCAAVRGNGHYIVTHFASLARIVEHYGVVDGIAGGSSGSLTAFVYDSVLSNPAVSRCGGAKRCDDAARAARVALALKSVEGYGLAVASSEEGVAIGNLVGVAAKLKQEVDARGIAALASTDAARAAAQLKEVLEIPEVRGLVNPEVFAMLRDTARLAYNVKEIHTSIATLGAFSVDDNRLFFRPGVLGWDSLALLFGRVADFYAGYGAADRDAQSAWLDACAEASVGKEWAEAAALPMPSGGTCGEAFGKLASDYRAAARAGGAPPRRLEETIGAPSALRKVVSTSVLEGEAVASYEQARAAYLSGEHASGDVPFDVSFDDVKFGYWGAAEDLAALAADGAGFGDLKTRKMTPLGDATWREILTASPAEPGLSRFVELPDGRISAGGWSDLAPTLVLKNLGCERVVYVTREGDESGFATKIAKHLGMTEAEWQKLYDLGDARSSYNVSLEEADAVWCTNWNSFGDLQQREMAADSWRAPLETREGFAGIRALAPYANTTPRTGKVGCTPGVSGGATYPR